MKLVVKENLPLLEYLYKYLDMPKKKIKTYLTYGNIVVNNNIITQYDYLLEKGMSIDINTKNRKTSNSFFNILYEDNYIIVVNKPGGLLTIATSKEKEKTLYHYVSTYLKEKNKNSKVFIVHRLDKETSGIVLFAKDEKTKNIFQKDWNSLVSIRGYYALVHGVLEKKSDRLVDKLLETKTNYVYITKKNEGKEAITNYQVEKQNKMYSLLKINIETGRKNQIRVQLANINHPIVGDSKYGIKDNEKKLYLIANKLKLYNPILKKEMSFEIDIKNSCFISKKI